MDLELQPLLSFNMKHNLVITISNSAFEDNALNDFKWDKQGLDHIFTFLGQSSE